MAAIPRNLALLGVVSFLMDTSTEMTYGLLPLYVTTLGGTALAVGLMEGTAESVSAFLKFYSGRLSDRWRRRKGLTVAGYGFSAINKAALAAATAAWHVVGLRTLDRVGKGIRGAPRDALIADSVPPRRWGFAFGFHRMMDTLGALAGPLIALALVALITVRQIFLVAAIPALLSLLVLLWVREPKHDVATKPRKVPFPHNQALLSYLLVIVVFTMANFGFLFLLLLGAQTGLSTAEILQVQIMYVAVYAVLAWPLGAVTDRIGRVPVLALAFAALIAANLLVVGFRADTFSGFLIPAAIFGLSSAAYEGNGRALAADLAPVDARATVLGAYHAAIGFASLPAGLLMGLLWENFLPAHVFAVGALFATAALMELAWLWFKGDLRVRHPA